MFIKFQGNLRNLLSSGGYTEECTTVWYASLHVDAQWSDAQT
jgi:hypothetical protein